MQSIVLVDSSYDYYSDRGGGGGPAKSDPALLPLGLIPKPDGTKSTIDPARQRYREQSAAAGNGSAQTRPSPPPPLSAAAAAAAGGAAAAGAGGGQPGGLPPPPEGPPVMVLFPATLHLAIFFVPPPRATIVSAIMSLMVMLGSWGWGWGMLSTAGVGSGLAAGFAAGVGVRTRPVGGWSYAALSVLGVALLGGRKASVAFGVSLALSTLWRDGWWLYFQPECAPVMLMLSGTTADVALGFLLASLLQIHGTPPPPPKDPQDKQDQPRQQLSTEPSTLPQPEVAAAHQQSPFSVSQGGMWTAVTPPGITAPPGGRRW